MSVKHLTSVSEYHNAIKQSGLVVLDFTAAWCGPCRMIAPKVDELASLYSHVHFYKIDVDEAQEVAAKADVSAMPTFHFYRDGALVGSVTGADVGKIKSHLVQYA